MDMQAVTLSAVDAGVEVDGMGSRAPGLGWSMATETALSVALPW